MSFISYNYQIKNALDHPEEPEEDDFLSDIFDDNDKKGVGNTNKTLKEEESREKEESREERRGGK